MAISREVEELKRYLKKKGGVNYYTTLSSEKEQKSLEGILYSNGTLNIFVYNLLFS